jgi:GT2 family glycosyltransferase
MITGALRWTIGHLSELLARSEPEERSLPWGSDAGGDPAAYRAWLSEVTERREQGETARTALPTDGPLLSVLVPVYRPETWYLSACIESVRMQTYRNWELCVCDDASGDEGVTSVLARFASADDRIKVVVHDTNGGISRATNSALAIAKGEYAALLDHDDSLDPDALAEIAAALRARPDADVLYTDNDKMYGQDYRFEPHFKTDWAPDLLLSFPYLGHLLVVRRDLLESVGGFRPEFDGSQDYDVMLRVTEKARRVVHVPRVLYHWRSVAGSAAGDEAAKPWAHDASRRVLEDALRRRSIDATVEDGEFRGWYHVRRKIVGRPSVSVVIPFRDQASLTARCLASLETAPGYDVFEFVLVDNGSVEPETLALRERIERLGIRVLEYPGSFNWSAINNYAASESHSDLILFMNNDIEASKEGWLHALVELAQLPDVGAVGARLLYPDGVLQHAGVVLGMAGIAGHIFTGMPAGWHGYFGWDMVVRPFSAVTGACMLSPRALFEEMGGFDEAFTVAYGDVDYCMRLADAGHRCLYTPHAEMVHHESVSRGASGQTGDARHFARKWSRDRFREDPFYNPNLSRFSAWCPLRPVDEDQRWEWVVDELVS